MAGPICLTTVRSAGKGTCGSAGLQVRGRGSAGGVGLRVRGHGFDGLRGQD